MPNQAGAPQSGQNTASGFKCLPQAPQLNSSGSGGAAAESSSTGLPHSGQKLIPALSFVPQRPQESEAFNPVPHDPQKLMPEAATRPQAGQVNPGWAGR